MSFTTDDHVGALERVNHRYHQIRVIVALCSIGVINLAIGLGELIDPESDSAVRYFGGSIFVTLVCGLAVLFLVKGGGKTTKSVEITMLAGLFATFGNMLFGGLLAVDPWWQVSAHIIVVLILAAVCLRRWSTYCGFALIVLSVWAVAVGTVGMSRGFAIDNFVVIAQGALLGGAVLWLFQIERHQVSDLNMQLHTSATHDPLTGALNRQGLIDSVLRSGKDGLEAWCAYVDVDFFKSINDLRGHDHGDEVLRSVAESLSAADGELTARWGGDEFVTVGFGPPPTERDIEERILPRVREVEPNVSVSVGQAIGTVRTNEELDALIGKADRQMYERRAMARGSSPEDSPTAQRGHSTVTSSQPSATK